MRVWERVRKFLVAVNASVRGFTRDWLPLVLSVATVAISWMAYSDAHRTSVLAVKPSVDFLTETQTEEPVVGIEVINAGPGPAIIQDIAYFVDGKKVRDVYGATSRFPRDDADQIRYLDFDSGDVLAANEGRWLISRKTDKAQSLDAFVAFLDEHLTVGISYCALRGGCWSRCSKRKACGAAFN